MSAASTTDLSRRRALLRAAAAVAAAVTAHAARAQSRSLDDWRRLLAAPAVAPDAGLAQERARLLHEGEACLARGDGAAAQELFQRAALMAHAADTECGIVRAHMQSGEYRRALAFGAHAALAHRDFAPGAGLYAWLLHVGGQAAAAQRQLDDALARHAGDAALRAVREALGLPQPVAGASLLAPPARLAPYAHGPGVDARGMRLLSGAVLGNGHSAWAPRAALQGMAAHAPLVVRNGLGLTVRAAVAEDSAAPDDASELVRLRLLAAMPWPDALGVARATAFAGAPSSVIAFAPQADAAVPAWPLLKQVFIGRLLADGNQALALQATHPSTPGATVFDRQGRLAGIALAHADGHDRFMPCARWPAAERLADAAPATSAASGPDDNYERALHVTLQLLTPLS